MSYYAPQPTNHPHHRVSSSPASSLLSHTLLSIYTNRYTASSSLFGPAYKKTVRLCVCLCACVCNVCVHMFTQRARSRKQHTTCTIGRQQADRGRGRVCTACSAGRTMLRHMWLARKVLCKSHKTQAVRYIVSIDATIIVDTPMRAFRSCLQNINSTLQKTSLLTI